MISGMCLNRGLKVITKNSDFNSIKRVEPSLLLAFQK